MGYKPQPIAPLSSGIDKSLPPEFIPLDAYDTLNNMYVRRGVLQSRNGYTKLFEFPNIQTTDTVAISAITKASPGEITTTAPHGLASGTLIQIDEIVGMTELNFNGSNTYIVVSTGASTLTLTTLTGTAVNTTSYNAYVSGGVITPSITIASATQADPVVITTTVDHGFSDGDRIYITGAQGMSELNGNTYTVANATSNTFELTDADGDDIDGTGYNAYTGQGVISKFSSTDVITGIIRYYRTDGSENILVFTKTRMAYYEDTIGGLVPVSNFSLFTGDSANFFLGDAFQNSVYFTNGVDNIGRWQIETNTLSFIQPKYGSGSTDVVITCKQIHSFKDRLILLAPTQTGTDAGIKGQRLLASKLNDVLSANAWRVDIPGNGFYIDASTGETLYSSAPYKDVIIVSFINSLWRIRPVSNPSLPFIWERIDTLRGVESRKSLANTRNTVMGVGQEGIFMCDGVNVVRVDEKIPNFSFDTVEQEVFFTVYCERDDILRQVWWTYPSKSDDSVITETVKDSSLIYGEDEANYANYLIHLNVLNRFQLKASDARWIDYNGNESSPNDKPDWSWEEFPDDQIWGSGELQKGTPIFIGGTYDGKVVVVNDQNEDDGAAIEVELVSREFNPFLADGKKCRLGYIDILLQFDDQLTFYVDFYSNFSLNPYATRQVNCIPKSNDPEVITRLVKRVYAGAIANSHRFKIYTKGSPGSLKIEGITPYFSLSGGRLYNA